MNAIAATRWTPGRRPRSSPRYISHNQDAPGFRVRNADGKETRATKPTLHCVIVTSRRCTPLRYLQLSVSRCGIFHGIRLAKR
jgi:hypothetical protein